MAKLPRVDYAALVECVRAETYRDPIGAGQEQVTWAAGDDVVRAYLQAHPCSTIRQVQRALRSAVKRGLLVGGPDSGYITKEAFR